MAATKETKTFTFEDLRKQITENFVGLASAGRLFYVAIDRDEIWEQYLSGYEEPYRQEHNCNCCKSFLRQFGGIVGIEENKMISLWDNLDAPEQWKGAIDNLSKYIHGRPITEKFFTENKNCGTFKNLDRESGVMWHHFYLEMPRFCISKEPEAVRGSTRDDRNVLARSLKELSIESSETVLELIGQDSLYRGKEFEGLIKAFLLLQRQFDRLPEAERENFCWVAANDAGAVSRIRNTAIGTLLIDLSEGLDLDTAVTKFEKVMAPANYKRPTSLVTPKMVEEAKEKLSELGLLESLERRYANETDIRACDILFMDRPAAVTDVFDEMAKETTVNPRSLTKTEEISIDEFMQNVVPKAKSISVLLENSHLNNLMTLVTSKDPEAPSLFKWGNNVSWSYCGAIADSIKERVKQAGGNVEGELRCSLSWYNHDDLDIHVLEPSRFQICYSTKRSPTGGQLDVDMNAFAPSTRTPVENIIWPDKSRMLEGAYKLIVNNFCRRETRDEGFEVQIECQGQIFDFAFKTNPRHQEAQRIVEFEYSKENGVKFKGEVKADVVSKEKWGIKTNQFHKVTKMLLSPNHWEKPTGNKHYFFTLEGCVSDEMPRPFFNEFLKPDLEKHRKVFEILGGKVKIEDTQNQLSGLGFSETKRASVIVKVQGKFTRTLKVNI